MQYPGTLIDLLLSESQAKPDPDTALKKKDLNPDPASEDLKILQKQIVFKWSLRKHRDTKW